MEDHRINVRHYDKNHQHHDEMIIQLQAEKGRSTLDIYVPILEHLLPPITYITSKDVLFYASGNLQRGASSAKIEAVQRR